jgi:hypothetical protein
VQLGPGEALIRKDNKMKTLKQYIEGKISECHKNYGTTRKDIPECQINMWTETYRQEAIDTLETSRHVLKSLPDYNQKYILKMANL